MASDSDEGPRVVKKTTDKRTEALTAVFEKMKNHTKNGDFVSLQNIDLEAIQKEIQACIDNKVFGTDKLQTLPGWVLKNLMLFEDCIIEVTPEEKKKMNKTSAQAFTKCKQKLNKYLAETGDDENFYEAQVKKFREEGGAKSESGSDSGSDDSDSSSGSDSSSSGDSSSESDKKTKKKKAKDSGSSGSSSSDEDDSSSSSSSSSGSSSGSGSDKEETSDNEYV